MQANNNQQYKFLDRHHLKAKMKNVYILIITKLLIRENKKQIIHLKQC